MMAGESCAAALVVALGGRWRGRSSVCLCPAHDDSNPSLSVSISADELVLVHCFAGCGQGAVVDALRLRGLWPDADESFRLRGTYQACPRLPEPALEVQRWSSKAEGIWQSAHPIAGSLVEVYLRSRRCWIEEASDLRCTIWRAHPAIVARVTDAASGEALTLHFTLLALDGRSKAPVEHPRLLLAGHRKKGGVIRLSADDEVTLGLGVTEGIETALSVMTAGWRPIWAAIDAGNLSSLPVISGIEGLTVFADQDEAGLRAAGSCAERWRAAGCGVMVVAPPIPGTDWNEVGA